MVKEIGEDPHDDVGKPGILGQGRRLLRGLMSAVCGCDALTPNDVPGGEPGDMRLRSGASSLVGAYRSHNEDRCFNNCRSGVLLIADGIGGHRGGALASRILIDVVPPYLTKALADQEVDTPRVTDIVREAIEQARGAMAACAEREPKYRQMGATMALALILDDMLYATHVGDCRIYHCRDGQIRRLTSDQTFVQVLLDAGTINHAEARTHPYRHHVLNWVGVAKLDAPPEITTMRMSPGDRVVLTTDGVHDVLDDQCIAGIVQRHGHPQAAADALVVEAIANDSKDNVSCIVAEMVGVHQRDETPETVATPALEVAAA